MYIGSPDTSKDKIGKPTLRKQERIIAILSTIGASAGYALMLSLTQFSFEKVLKKDTFLVVFEMQIYTSIVATFFCVLGLFSSTEFMDLKSEMEKFNEGKAIYVASLIGTVLALQICTVGVVGLVYLVSSLFSNVVSMLSLPFVPVVGVVFVR
ncbi:F-box/FBD/LRR-repeat protein [Hibiscus syriacus]|uniref:F-box/FBD/LRR-repeat protein n=1 Tax=Hibiscus syriacus TaxID=106335 RepID=A0A6A3C805_HIBSY|nr:F-box/FBD/LRR-repeat protein [Hibiscus syriacus]